MNRVVAAVIVLATTAALVVNVVWGEWPFVVIPFAVSPLAFVGALLVFRVPRNVVSWLLSASGLLFEATLVGNTYAWLALVREPGRWPAGELAAAIGSVLFAPALSFAVLMLLFFPSGRGLGGRWTWIERGLMTIALTIVVTTVFKEATIEVTRPDGPPITFPNPFALDGLPGRIVTFVGHVGDSWTIPIVFAGPVSLFVRYRRSSPTEREQIKWLAYAGAVSLTLLVASNLSSGDLSNWLWAIGACTLGLLPIAIAVAIFRYRLYDIDILIRRTLVYASVSAVLLATYVAAVAVLELVLAPLTGGSGIAVAISTLAVLALFQPLRRRIQGAVDRRFYRAKYDAELTLDVFASRLRDQVDLAALEAELLSVVGETVQPVQASVWLRDGSAAAD